MKIIRKLNKRLNSISIVTLLFGGLSVIWTAQIASNLWAAITISSAGVGLVSLLASFLIKSSNPILINKEEISTLNINSKLKLNELKNSEDVEYLGNWVYLKNGKKYEIDRIHILNLTKILDPTKIAVKQSKQKFYNISPKELLKSIINLGP